MKTQRAYEPRELNGFKFGVRPLYKGRSIYRWELVKQSDAPWPSDDDLLKYFGERGFGGRVQHAGPIVLVEVYVD